MIAFIETLDYDDKEIFWQVMTEALEQMTKMQRQCLLMSIIGFEQTAIGKILGVNNKSVSYHFNNALDKIMEISKEVV